MTSAFRDINFLMPVNEADTIRVADRDRLRKAINPSSRHRFSIVASAGDDFGR
jgi:hypothetical protein